MTLDEIAKACEQADGPDRSIDGLIATALGVSMPDDPAGWPPRYTASLDAAATIVPEGVAWAVSRDEVGKFFAECEYYAMDAKTGPTALAAAALVYRSEEMPIRT